MACEAVVGFKCVGFGALFVFLGLLCLLWTDGDGSFCASQLLDSSSRSLLGCAKYVLLRQAL